MLSYLTIALTFTAATIMAFAVLSLLAKRSDPTIKRLRQVGGYERQQAQKRKLIKEGMLSKKKIVSSVQKASTAISYLAPCDARSNSKLKIHLIQAGYRNENSTKFFLGFKLLLAVFLSAGCLFFGLLLGKNLSLIITTSSIFAFMGYYLPNLWLHSMIRKRQTEITYSLPDALDLLVICVEAGLGLNSAIIRVGEEFKVESRALSEEFLLVNQEMRTGRSRPEALRNLSDRTGVEDLKSLVAMLIQTDRLGTNLAQSLRAQSDSLRSRRRQRAQEAAAKTTIKLVFPLVFFIFPALFVTILGPGLIQIFKSLEPIIQR